MIRRIRDLLYDQGFTISGARNKLQDGVQAPSPSEESFRVPLEADQAGGRALGHDVLFALPEDLESVRRELFEIRNLLSETA